MAMVARHVNGIYLEIRKLCNDT